MSRRVQGSIPSGCPRRAALGRLKTHPTADEIRTGSEVSNGSELPQFVYSPPGPSIYATQASNKLRGPSISEAGRWI
jgi:hypothetical protein